MPNMPTVTTGGIAVFVLDACLVETSEHLLAVLIGDIVFPSHGETEDFCCAAECRSNLAETFCLYAAVGFG